MHRKEANLQSPLRLLDRALRGGLGRGRLGVVAAPAGVGKSASLVQIGLDALLRDRPVLHVAAGASVEHVSAWYDAAFDELAARVDLADRGGVRAAIAHRRLIWAVAGGRLGARGIDEALAAFRAHLALELATILVDGFEWEEATCAATLGALKERAAGAGAELWMTARDAERCAADVVDVALLLEPRGRHVRVKLVDRLHGGAAVDLPLVLDGGTLRPLRADEAAGSAGLAPDTVTLLASGSAGAEEEFGACAERWGVNEVNFTFRGRGEIARTRGLVELSDDELRLGAVSAVYVKAHMHRAFHEGAARVLQAIWHQVSTADEVFAVGALNPDKTAHGGTGWAVELARHWGKPVHLFDEERQRWFGWDGRDWVEEAPPAITRARFAGAGTRAPSEGGRAAIRALFERSFGAARP